MSSTVFQIKNGSAWHDYSDMVKMSGMSWKRNDLDADGSGRSPLDGYMWRSVVARKRSISYDLMPDREARYASLDTDLQPPFFAAYRRRPFIAPALRRRWMRTLRISETGPEESLRSLRGNSYADHLCPLQIHFCRSCAHR